jgi:8-oxo-dGTP pyrophosphatase MutT (NUDIX family)
MTEARPPKKASTVILIRPEIMGKFEIFMTRRPPEMKFFGGVYVFPGGTVRKSDCSEEMLSRCHGLSRSEAQRILGNHLSPELSLGHWVAGIRELYEEVGIFLCVKKNGKHLDMTQEKHRERMAQKREALVEGAIDFRVLLESEGLYCDVGSPVFFYHRVTPESYPMRFDTCFYLAGIPSGQTPLSSSQEVAESLWITPEQALNQFQKGDFPLMPPTLYSLRTLADIDSWQNLCAKYPLR